MTRAICNLMAVVALPLVCAPVAAQQEKPTLPRVLIIGDAVYQNHARTVSSVLKDRVNVQIVRWPKAVLPSSTNMIEHLDLLLGLKDAAGNDVPDPKRPTWDVIHFNAGLGDLIHCVPNIKSHRVLPYTAGGVLRTKATQYEKNLDTLVRLLKQKAPDAKIIWASTTPIRYSRQNVFKLGTEIEYNTIAARVMNKHGVPINDMYAYVRSFMDMDKPAGHGVDPFHFDKKPIHPPIVQTICKALGVAVPAPEPKDDTKK